MSAVLSGPGPKVSGLYRRAYGIMQQISTSGQYEIVEREKLEIEKWKTRMEAERNKAEEIARVLKERGIDEKLIKDATGLKLWDIRRL